MRKLLLPLLLWTISSLCLSANPTGGVVANGSASIAGQGTPSVLINQSSDRAIINWQTFSIGSGELTKFVQPSSTSATLNRVLGGQTSFINGTLSANGQVFLLNGNGIVVGAGGVISTAGFTGSTRDINDTDFMSNNLHFVGSGDGGVKNLGTISALGGDVVLIGKTVENRGTIKAGGTAALVAGDDVLLAQKNADGSTVTVNAVLSPTTATKKVGVKNTGVIEASSAELKAANGNIYALAIQNKGLIQATTVTHQGGHIFLTSDSGTIVNSGTLNASATVAGGHGGTILVKSTTGKVVHSGSIVARGGQGGAGGSAEISAPSLDFTGTVDLRADGGESGDLLLDPYYLIVTDTGYLAASGGTQPDTNPNDPAGQTETSNGTISEINSQTVDAALNNSNLTLNADALVEIDAAINWTSGTTLKLSTNNNAGSIAINAPIAGPGGNLILNTLGQISTDAAGTISVANFYLQAGAWFQLIDDGSGNGGDLPETYDNQGNPESILPAFTVTNDFEISPGATFLRADGGNGSSVYYGLQDIYGVQGISGYLNSGFTLNGRYIDATVTANWNPTTVNGNTVNEGFLPIAFGSEAGFTGSLQYGTIANLTINHPADNNIGLFSVVAGNGFIYNFQLNYANITGANYIGGFAGENFGQIDNVTFFNGSVTGTNTVGGVVGLQGSGYVYEGGPQFHLNGSQDGYSTVTGVSQVGGLVGENQGQIDGASVYNTTVTGNSYVGGISGENDYVAEGPQATITFGTFNGNVTFENNEGESYNLGGIVGENDGVIQYSNTLPGSYVNGDLDVGGVAGYNSGRIQDSYNSASVSGSNQGYNVDNAYIGGITGENGSLETGGQTSAVISYATTNGPTFQPQYGNVQTSYNTGTVMGGSYVGGLVGSNDTTSNIVTTAYNVGQVIGGDHVGGIVGDNYGTVEYVYNSGAVSGTTAASTGALVGENETGALTTNSYWDDSVPGAAATDLNGTAGINIGTVETSGSAYEVDDNNTGTGAGYGYFGAAVTESSVSDLLNNGVYEIGTLPSGDASTANSSAAWFILPGDTRPILTVEFSGNVQNAHQLQLISTDLGGNFDVTQAINGGATNNPSEVWSAQGFSPIGGDPASELNAFTGTFYGNGETITALNINRPTTADVGLFGYVGAAGEYGYNIEYINFTNSVIAGSYDVGLLAGVNTGAISYVTANDTVLTGANIVGGVVGSNSSTGVISNVNATTDGTGSVSGVVSTSDNIGGIAGINSGTISLAQNALSVTGNGNVGGIAGTNAGAVLESANTGTVTGSGQAENSIGGITGFNAGTVSQTSNLGDIGGNGNTDVGGIVGENEGQVDDSYSGGGSDAGTITGSDAVGGLVGLNYGTLESSYSTSHLTASTGANGYLVGDNFGTVRYSYWNSDYSDANVTTGIGASETGSSAVDAVGYSQSGGQLANANNYAQGAPPTLWNFTPQGTSAGVWGIDVYQNNGSGTVEVNDGLPVLQWQTPVNVAVVATNGTQTYGYTPGYTVSGSGASLLPSYMPGGVAFSETGGNQAGDTDQLTVAPTAINTTGFNIEFLDGTVNIVPATLDIVANSYTIPVGSPAPDYGATYTGLQNGDTPSSLNGMLEFTVPPNATNMAGLYSILVSGQSSPNYVINFINGTLNVFAKNVQDQPLLTAQAEVSTIQNFFANDPTNGLDPVYFLSLTDGFGLGGDLLGAVNNEPDATDYAYASSTSGLPAFQRLVVPDTGVVEILDGTVVVGSPQTGKPIYLTNPGGFLPAVVVDNFHNVLSPAAYNQLLALINAH